MNPVLFGGALLLAGGLAGYSVRAIISMLRKNSLELSISERMLRAREQAQTIIDEAHEKSERVFVELKKSEDRLIAKEILVDKRQYELDVRTTSIDKKVEELLQQEQELQALTETEEALLEQVAGLNREQARALLLKETEEVFAEDLQVRMHKLDNVMKETIDARAKNILVTAIQRLAVPTASELTTASVLIPNDETKGKIIGKEGRNIRTFERFTGVELLVDEAPGSIIVSCFDPVRRTIAVRALENLIKDGRIQPARIEEEIETARAQVHEIIKEKGGAAVFECGIYNFDPRLIAILGRLHFRTSYGQNVLQHSIEMAHMAGILAAEIGADVYIAKAGALVHDIGKALDHEFEGTHIDIGIKVLRRFGTDERIVTAMKSHHDDVPHETLEAVIVQTADMISSTRPGARRDTAELYIKRLTELEGLASRFEGVDRAYALQAGREVRIFVHPETVNDFQARNLARTIAMGIETELRYPGQIKVTIIRETRITDYAR